MELYNPYKWPYNWVNGVITPISGVITLLITGTGPTLYQVLEIYPPLKLFSLSENGRLKSIQISFWVQIWPLFEGQAFAVGFREGNVGDC